MQSTENPDRAPAERPASSGENGVWRLVRRVGIGIAGSIVLAVGLVLLVTPGPAFVVIPIGLGILSIEFDWARRWLKRVKEYVRKALPKNEQRAHAAHQADSRAR